MRIRSKLLVPAFLLLSAPLLAMQQMPPTVPAADSAIAFETATIKPSKPDESYAIQIQGRRFATFSATLMDIMKYAYGLHEVQILGVPEQLLHEKFDVLADPPTETRPSSDQMKALVRGLITERFAMRYHMEKRQLPVYAIVVAKGGPKLVKSKESPDFIPSVSLRDAGRFNATNASMQDIASFLQRYMLERPVIDQTGIQGRFDVKMAWTPVESADKPDALPGFYTAIEEQLGLKLATKKAPVDVLVIDHIEQPSEN